MNVGLTQEIDSDLEDKSELIIKINNKIKLFFDKKIMEMILSIILLVLFA